MPKSQTSDKKIKILERQLNALSLRRQGGDYETIATQMRSLPDVSPKYNRSQAYKDVRAALDRLIKETKEEAEHYKRLQLERLDEIFVGVYQHAIKGDATAISRVLALMEKMDMYHGISTSNTSSAPRGASVSVTTSGGTTEQIKITEVLVELHGDPHRTDPNEE